MSVLAPDLAAIRLILAVSAVDAPVPPLVTSNGVMLAIDPPVIATALEFCVAIEPTVVVAPDWSPKFVRASGALTAPVPPLANDKAAPKFKEGR